MSRRAAAAAPARAPPRCGRRETPRGAPARGLTAAGAPPPAERAFRILVDEIPAPGAGKAVRMALRVSLPVFAHPVLDGEELRGYDASHADLRARDAACLLDPAVARLLDGHGIVRISFRELRGGQRAG